MNDKSNDKSNDNPNNESQETQSVDLSIKNIEDRVFLTKEQKDILRKSLRKQRLKIENCTDCQYGVVQHNQKGEDDFHDTTNYYVCDHPLVDPNHKYEIVSLTDIPDECPRLDDAERQGGEA